MFAWGAASVCGGIPEWMSVSHLSNEDRYHRSVGVLVPVPLQTLAGKQVIIVTVLVLLLDESEDWCL